MRIPGEGEIIAPPRSRRRRCALHVRNARIMRLAASEERALPRGEIQKSSPSPSSSSSSVRRLPVGRVAVGFAAAVTAGRAGDRRWKEEGRQWRVNSGESVVMVRMVILRKILNQFGYPFRTRESTPSW